MIKLLREAWSRLQTKRWFRHQDRELRREVSEVDRRNLDRLLRESAEQVRAMSPTERDEMIRLQGESWARAEASWPKARYKWVDGAKVYETYADYCND
jgi:hypothetical protein